MRTPVGEIVVVRVVGEVDIADSDVLDAALAQAWARRPSHLVVDIAAMGFCSVRGLAVLVHGTAGSELGGEYLLGGVGPRVERLVTLLWPADALPARHRSAAGAVLAAMADQHDRRPPTGRMVPTPRRAPDGAERPDTIADEPTDHVLTERARTGDGGAYRELAHRHRIRMYRGALRMLGSPADPADAAGDLATRLRTALTAFGSAGPP